MEEYSKNEEFGNQGIHRVRDPLSILIVLAFIAMEVFVVYKMIEGSNGFGGFGDFLIIIAIFVLPVLRLIAIWNGVEIDYDNGILTLPGGGISANSIFDYLNPVFMFQYFLRKEVKLSEIKSISTSVTSKVYGDSGKRMYKYLISIIGKFGGITLTYKDENKRDEIYSLIREINRMGTPFMRS